MTSQGQTCTDTPIMGTLRSPRNLHSIPGQRSSPGSNATSTWRFTRVVADHHGRAAAAALTDVGQAAYRPVAYGGRWLDARRVIDRSPLSDHFSPVGACPLSVVPVEQALVGCHVRAGAVGDGLCGLRGSQKRAGDDGAGHLGAEHGREPPGLLVSGLIERRGPRPSPGA